MNEIKIPRSTLRAMREVSDYIRESEFDHWRETGFHPNHVAARMLEIEMWEARLHGIRFAEVRFEKKQPIAILVLGSNDMETQTNEIQEWCVGEGFVLDDIRDRRGKVIVYVSEKE